MTPAFRPLAALVLAASLCSCAHWVPVQVTIPARKALPGVKSVAVANFREQTPLALQMGLGGQIAGGVTEGLARNNILNVQRLPFLDSASDFMLVTSAPGGVDAVLTGDISQAEVRDSNPVQKQVAMPVMVDGNLTTVNVVMVDITRSAQLNVSYRLLRVPTGEMVCGDAAARNGQILKTGETVDKTLALLPTPDAMIGPFIPSVVEQFVADLTPRTVQERRRLLSGDDVCEQGIESADRSLWDEAQLYWEESSQSAEHPKDRAAAFYNLAVYYEIHNNFEKAREALAEARSIRPSKSLFLDYQVRINRRETQFQAVERQREIMETPVP